MLSVLPWQRRIAFLPRSCPRITAAIGSSPVPMFTYPSADSSYFSVTIPGWNMNQSMHINAMIYIITKRTIATLRTRLPISLSITTIRRHKAFLCRTAALMRARQSFAVPIPKRSATMRRSSSRIPLALPFTESACGFTHDSNALSSAET